jgi:SPP1 family predicted phage head-tail adaptor
MMFSEVIKLYNIDNEARTELGGRDPKVVSQRELFASRESVRQSEFYQAMQAGLETRAVFKAWTHEYEEERVLEHKGKYFTIVRTYEDGDYIYLTCTKRKGILEEAIRM